MIPNTDYHNWIAQLKQRFQQAQIKAAVQVNSHLLRFYWELGAEIVEKQEKADWGSNFMQQLSSDLAKAFPDMKGFSFRNIMYIRQWYLFYSQDDIILQQLVAKLQEETIPPIEENGKSQHLVGQLPGQTVLHLNEIRIDQLFHIPWGHHIAIISKCESVHEALYYVTNTLKHGWSRSVLIHQIESRLHNREGKAVSNFSQTLPAPQSDLAIQTLKDPYVFDFFTMRADFNERELELRIESSNHRRN